jgi:hypothetical protein
LVEPDFKGEFAYRTTSLNNKGKVEIISMSPVSIDIKNPPAGKTITKEIVQQKAIGSIMLKGEKQFANIGTSSTQYTGKEQPRFIREFLEPTDNINYLKRVRQTYDIDGGVAEIGGNVNELVSEGKIKLIGEDVKIVEAGKLPKNIKLSEDLFKANQILSDVKKGFVKGDLDITGIPEGKYNIIKGERSTILSKWNKRGNPFTIENKGTEIMLNIKSGLREFTRLKTDYGIIDIYKVPKKSKPYDEYMNKEIKKTSNLIQSNNKGFGAEEGGEQAMEKTTGQYISELTSVQLPTQTMFSGMKNIADELSVSGIGKQISSTLNLVFEKSPRTGSYESKTTSFIIQTNIPIMQPIISPMMTPINTPITTPIVTPIITPIITPITEPVISPIITPITTPIVTPIITPIITPIVTPIVTPIPTRITTPLINNPPTDIIFGPGFGYNKKKPIRRMTNAYSVLLKKRGKFVPVAGGLSLGGAMRLGSERTLKELARTFKVVKSGTRVSNEIEDYMPKDNLFRGYAVRKGKAQQLPFGVYIQRTKANLQTPEEKMLIKEAKRSKRFTR